MQKDRNRNTRLYQGPIDCAVKVYKNMNKFMQDYEQGRITRNLQRNVCNTI